MDRTLTILTRTMLAQNLPIRWQAPSLLPAVVIVGVALAAAVLWLYPRQVRPVRRPWRYIIPGLRLLALIALAVSIARPVALRARPVEDRGVLLVLIDRSRSMSIADNGRRPAELIALADSLNLLPVGVRAAATASISADFEQLQAAVGQAIRAQGDMDYARVSGRGIEPAEARVHKGVEEARTLGKALAARSTSLPGESGLKDKLKPLGELPIADLRGGWIADTRRRLDQAAVAIATFQDQVDDQLFQKDAEVRRVCTELQRRSRFDLAAEALVRPGGLLSRLGSDTQAIVFGFADRTTSLGVLRAAPPSSTMPAESSDIGDAEATAPIHWTGSRVALKPEGVGTDISGALAAALAASGGKPIRGVLVIGDGQQVGAESVASVMPPGVPLIAVSAAGPKPPKDISIVEVISPQSVFVGETAVVRARIRATGGLAADASTARLTLAGSESQTGLMPAVVDPPAGRKEESSTWAVFSVKFDVPGVRAFTVSIPPVDGEISDENNFARRSVKVLPERIRVAAYAGSAGWDFQYLRSSLARRGWFDIEAGILDPAKARLPLTPSQILRENVLILYDVPVAALDREQWFAVDRLVTQHGGSVIFIAGVAFSPGSFADQPLASALLPFNFQVDRNPAWRIWPGDRPSIRLTPGPEFARSDLLRLDDTDTLNRHWQDMGGVYRVLPVRSAKPGVRTLLRDVESGASVVTEMRPGAGRAIYVGLHETWRWRARGGEAAQERFWRQLVRHASEEPYGDHQGRLAIDIDRVTVAPGESVQIRARVFSGDDDHITFPLSLSTQPTLAVNGFQAELVSEMVPHTVLRTVKLIETPEGDGRLRAALTDLPAGRFGVRLAPIQPIANLDLPLVPLSVEPSTEAEMRNLSADTDRLRRMAESTGGRLLRLDQMAAVPGLLAAAADDRPRVVEWSLWDSPWLFGFVVACLGAEWALRKRAGLA